MEEGQHKEVVVIHSMAGNKRCAIKMYSRLCINDAFVDTESVGLIIID